MLKGVKFLPPDYEWVRILPTNIFAGLAQLVELLTCNQWVGGSSPPSSIRCMGLNYSGPKYTNDRDGLDTLKRAWK